MGLNGPAKYDSSAYKLTKLDIDIPYLSVIPDEGLVTKRGPEEPYFIRTQLPIPFYNLKGIKKTTMAFYFEMETLSESDRGIGFGFGEGNFSQSQPNRFGDSNSIGMYGKDALDYDGGRIDLRSNDIHLRKGEIIGLGIIHHPNSKIKSFATFNEKLLGKGTLPTKFASIQLFPTIVLNYAGESVRVTFEREKWKFKEFKRVIE